MRHRLAKLNTLTEQDVIIAIKNIPANLSSLNLGDNDLGDKTGAELALILAAIPAQVITGNNGFLIEY